MFQNSFLKLFYYYYFFYSLLFLPYQQKTQFREALTRAYTMTTPSSPIDINWEVNLNLRQSKLPLGLLLLQGPIVTDFQEPSSDTSMSCPWDLTHHARASV